MFCKHLQVLCAFWLVQTASLFEEFPYNSFFLLLFCSGGYDNQVLWRRWSVDILIYLFLIYDVQEIHFVSNGRNLYTLDEGSYWGNGFQHTVNETNLWLRNCIVLICV